MVLLSYVVWWLSGRVHIWSSGCRPCRYPLRYKYTIHMYCPIVLYITGIQRSQNKRWYSLCIHTYKRATDSHLQELHHIYILNCYRDFRDTWIGHLVTRRTTLRNAYNLGAQTHVKHEKWLRLLFVCIVDIFCTISWKWKSSFIWICHNLLLFLLLMIRVIIWYQSWHTLKCFFGVVCVYFSYGIPETPHYGESFCV